MGLGLFWLALLFVRFREGAWVDGVWVFDDPSWAFDFAAYINAAQRLVDGGSLYAQALVTGRFEPGPADLFYYPPPFGVAMVPFTGMSFADGSALWWVLRVGALLLACALMPVRPLLRASAFAVVAFSLPGLKDSVIGNVSLLLVLPTVVAWRWLDRPVGSIAMALAISVRPSLGLFLLWQLMRRRWRAALWTIAAGTGLLLAALPFVGVNGHVEFAQVILNLDTPGAGSENRALDTLLISLGASPPVASIARLLSAGLALVATALSVRLGREQSYMVMLGASLLVGPLLWDHYLATLVVPAAFLAQRLWAPLILLPLLAWLPAAAPLLIITLMLLPFLVRDEGTSPRPVPLLRPSV